MSETLNDENAAGNDDVSERRAVEHRALEQCDVVHHGVVSGCPVNSCAAVLNEVMSQFLDNDNNIFLKIHPAFHGSRCNIHISYLSHFCAHGIHSLPVLLSQYGYLPEDICSANLSVLSYRTT